MAKTTTNTNDGFNELNVGSLKFYKPAEMTKGQQFTGTFIETKIMGKFDGPVHIFKRTLEDGTTEQYGINSTGQLGYYMDQVAPGSIVRLTYDGLEKLAKGKYAGKPAHNFKVAVSTTSPKLVVAAPKVEETEEADGDDFDNTPL